MDIDAGAPVNPVVRAILAGQLRHLLAIAGTAARAPIQCPELC